ncbi:MAG: O-acetylserine/cysteine exporter [Spirochaetae bacterium HGW-Spirochaetae-7]|nr:MAG: O-acetylserine/cysteine exporter [Spirochaetae bacterium HGW-Spirochaetae-7]
MPTAAIAEALLISAIWGFNFVVIKVGVAGVPPFMLAALRFVFCVFPAIIWIRKPAASWGALAAYGLFLGVVEFGFLFTAIKLGAPAGLSSLVLQSQAFFTALIAAAFLKERIRLNNVLGMVVAGAGLAVIAMAEASSAGGAARMSPPLFMMVIAAALGWAAANVIARTMPGTSGLGLMVWSSLFSPLPLAMLSLFFEGPERIAGALRNMSWLSVGALAYLVVLSTLVGYGLWNRLIMRHGAGRIAPFSLLVPIFGVASAALLLGESITALDAVAAVLILAGLSIHAFGSGMARRR